jgi:nitroimidazol reductase NimA-like FMN-containing flavoprotein (pyridoxamine 5'-phosphate oxidase superfamily)
MDPSSVSLNRAACLALLSTQTIGRLVFTQQALPDVLPAHYHLDGENVLLRLAVGSAAALASLDAVVAFESDHFDPDTLTGWSVTIVGQAREVARPDRHEAMSVLPSWGVDGGGLFLSLPAVKITGQRLVATPQKSLLTTTDPLSPHA